MGTGKIEILLVKPHPSAEIMQNRAPVQEQNRYHWEPVVLKLLSYHIYQYFESSVNTEIWHLINASDDHAFTERVKSKKPRFVVFTEIDILVNEVNRLSKIIKAIDESIITIVGGKQSSLLRVGDRSPFVAIDYIISGPAHPSLALLIRSLIDGKQGDIPGLLTLDGAQVSTINKESPPFFFSGVETRDISELEVFNHDRLEYYKGLQYFPAPFNKNERMASLLTSMGCVHHCTFCQNSVENILYKKQLPSNVDASAIAREIHHLNEKFGVNRFFSLAPNLDLQQLYQVYEELSTHHIDHMPVSGFIRVKDILQAKPILKELVKHGLNFLSVGLDIPIAESTDIYHKGFQYSDMGECLELCLEEGIALHATVVGAPEVTSEAFAAQLEMLKHLPIAQIDIRLAMALRNTAYFNKVKDFLIEPPDAVAYLERQNYRYQTIQFSGKITPAETYGLIDRFKTAYYSSSQYQLYKKRMIERNPETRLAF